MATICCNLVNASSQIALTNKTTWQAGLPSGIGKKSSWPDTQASVSPMAYLLLHTSISIEVCKWVLIDTFGFLILVYFFSQIYYIKYYSNSFYQVLGRLNRKKSGVCISTCNTCGLIHVALSVGQQISQPSPAQQGSSQPRVRTSFSSSSRATRPPLFYAASASRLAGWRLALSLHTKP